MLQVAIKDALLKKPLWMHIDSVNLEHHVSWTDLDDSANIELMVQETIATARENKDMQCLNFSLSWLYHFRTLYGKEIDSNVQAPFLGNNRKALEFLKTKAQENNMWSLVSSTLLNEAKLILAKVNSLKALEGFAFSELETGPNSLCSYRAYISVILSQFTSSHREC